MLVVSVGIEGRPSPRTGSEVTPEGDALEAARQEKILQLKNQIWQLKEAKDLRWLIITDDDLDLHGPKARRRMLWQLFCRFDVGRGRPSMKENGCWDATTPIPSESHGVRRWLRSRCTARDLGKGRSPPGIGGLFMASAPRFRTEGLDIDVRSVLEFVKVEHTLFSARARGTCSPSTNSTLNPALTSC